MNGEKKRQLIIAIAAFALFNFIFLCSEYLFDNVMMEVTSKQGVVNAQNVILGASVIGFILYSRLDDMLREGRLYVFAFLFVLVVSSNFFIMIISQYFVWILSAGIIAFLLLGITGSAVCYELSVICKNTKRLAVYIGIAYAGGIFLQFMNNNFLNDNKTEAVTLSISLTFFVLLLLSLKRQRMNLTENTVAKAEEKPIARQMGWIFIFCVALMACISSVLDCAVTLVHASGDFDIGQWPRLILACSGLLAGVLYDLCGRKYMHLIMYFMVMLSTISIIIIQLGGSFVLGLIVFYMSAGFFVVYFISGFIILSYEMENKKLWAGLGRAVNNLAACVVSVWSVKMLSDGNGMLILISAVILFACINVLLLLYLNKNRQLKDRSDSNVRDENALFEIFANQFQLTKREQEVLQQLICSDDNIQDLASAMFISRAALYRHISSLNEKTNTKSRIGLIQFYYNWIREN